MAESREIVTRAFRRLQAIDINEQPSESEMTHGLAVLSEMVNGWASGGIVTETQTLECDVTSGSKIVKGLDSTANLLVGHRISGTGIPANATIAAVLTATAFEMNVEATADGADVSLTFEFLPMPVKYEGACIALLAVRMSEDVGLPVSAKLAADADAGWHAILSGYIPDRKTTFDRALAEPAREPTTESAA